RCVGRLDTPPDSYLELLGDGEERTYAVNIFRDASLWEPSVEPVLSRMGMRLTWFQVGADNDHSFLGNPRIVELLAHMRTRMQLSAQHLKLSISWPWMDALPMPARAPWNARQYSGQPTMTADVMASYAAAA